MSTDPTELMRAFEANEINPSVFRHSDHVAVAYEMLSKYDFAQAAARYARGIRSLAIRAGVPQKFNATITFAFMSLIAERAAAAEHASYREFIVANPDLLSKGLLETWYTPERLRSDVARKVFVMPDARP